MNIERFHTIARAILKDIAEYNYPAKVGELVGQLRNRIANPGDPGPNQALDKVLTELRDNLPEIDTNSFPPTWRQHMVEHGLDNFFGAELLSKIEDTLQQNAVTPSTAERELTTLSKELAASVQALKNFVEAMERFKVGREQLAPGEAEIGVLIPRAAVKNDVYAFGKELTKIAKLVGVFQEIATGSRPELKIDSISSSDLSIFFMVDPATAKLWLDALNTLLETFKNIIAIRKGLEELRANGVPQEAVVSLEEHANGRMKATIKKTVDEVLNANGQVTRRRTELAVELEGSLTDVAIRMDHGFNFEVRAEPLEEEDPGPHEPAAAHAVTQENLKAVQAGSRTLQFLKLGGKPILTLAAPPATEAPPATQEAVPTTGPEGKGKPRSRLRIKPMKGSAQ